MNRQYKLLQWYPSLPKDWERGMKVGYGDRTTQLAPTNIKYTQRWVDCLQVQNNPEFWELVKEKDYEILSFTNIGIDGNVLKTPVYKFKDDGLYEYLFPCFDEEPVNYTKEKLLNSKTEIHSVKRLSDGRVYTVGDKVLYCGNKGTLLSIYFNEHNQLSFKIDKGLATGPNTGCIVSNKLKPIGKLFTTEDGVDIYEGDTVYNIRKEDYSLTWTHNIQREPKGELYWYFSTKEKAKEYIDENKPRYSKKDVLGAIEKERMGLGSCIFIHNLKIESGL